MRHAWVTLCLLFVPNLVHADPAALEYLERHGCVIGPDTAQELRLNGGDPEALGPLRAKGRTEGAWTVLPEEVCTLSLPDIASPLSLEDVAPYLSAPDAYAAEGIPGCFLDSHRLQEALIEQGQTEDEAFSAYMSFIAQGLVEGSWTFYGEDPLHTPLGLQYLAGTCGDIVGIDAIRASHAQLVELFGPYLRAVSAKTRCEAGATPMHYAWHEIMQSLTDEPIRNAWIAFEITMITMGAGWYESMGFREKGAPRPPVCQVL